MADRESLFGGRAALLRLPCGNACGACPAPGLLAAHTDQLQAFLASAALTGSRLGNLGTRATTKIKTKSNPKVRAKSKPKEHNPKSTTQRAKPRAKTQRVNPSGWRLNSASQGTPRQCCPAGSRLGCGARPRSAAQDRGRWDVERPLAASGPHTRNHFNPPLPGASTNFRVSRGRALGVPLG